MVRFIKLFLIGVFISFPSLCTAEVNAFKAKNPDIDKYFFAKNFIVGIGYYHRVAARLKTEADVATPMGLELEIIQHFIDNRTLDNTELRIARNYLTNFTSSRNGLIRKVAEDTIATYDKLIAMSVSERELWQSFYNFKKTHITEHIDEADFVRQQTEIALDKKEVAKELLLGSVLLRTVLLSAEKCDSEQCFQLAITKKERSKLIEKLDAFAVGNLAWGMKAGQSTVEACEAAIREVLEDPVYVSK